MPRPAAVVAAQVPAARAQPERVWAPELREPGLELLESASATASAELEPALRLIRAKLFQVAPVLRHQEARDKPCCQDHLQ
jgi:hypothetical protein